MLIEDKGSGTALMQALRAQYFYKATPFTPKEDKIVRLGGVTPTIEGGHVHLPQSAVWLDDYLHEICGFPGTKHDDQVDSTSQALHWIREQGAAGCLLEYYRQECEEERARREDRTVLLRVPHGISHVSMMDGTCFSVGPDMTIWVTKENATPLVASGYVCLR